MLAVAITTRGKRSKYVFNCELQFGINFIQERLVLKDRKS